MGQEHCCFSTKKVKPLRLKVYNSLSSPICKHDQKVLKLKFLPLMYPRDYPHEQLRIIVFHLVSKLQSFSIFTDRQEFVHV